MSEQVVQEGVKNFKGLWNRAIFEETLCESKQSTDTNILQDWCTFAKLEADGVHAGEDAAIEEGHEELVDEAKIGLDNSEGDILGVFVLVGDGEEDIDKMVENDLHCLQLLWWLAVLCRECFDAVDYFGQYSQNSVGEIFILRNVEQVGQQFLNHWAQLLVFGDQKLI